MSTIVQYIPQMWKAVFAFIGAASAEYGIAQVDGVTWGEWGYIIGTAAAVALAVWKVENART